MWFPKRIPAYPRVSALKDVRGDIVGAKHYFFRWSMHLAYQTLVLLPGIHYYITRYALESNLRHFKRDFQPQCFMPKPPQTSTNHGAHLTRSPPPTEHALDTQSNHPACQLLKFDPRLVFNPVAILADSLCCLCGITTTFTTAVAVVCELHLAWSDRSGPSPATRGDARTCRLDYGPACGKCADHRPGILLLHLRYLLLRIPPNFPRHPPALGFFVCPPAQQRFHGTHTAFVASDVKRGRSIETIRIDVGAAVQQGKDRTVRCIPSHASNNLVWSGVSP